MQRHTYKRDRAIITVLLDTGISVSELCDAKISDFDPKNGRLIITGKGKKSRIIYMGNTSRQALWNYLVQCYPKDKPRPDDPLFLTNDNLFPMTRNGVLLLLKRLGEKAEVNHVYPNRFRHTFAIEFLRNGGNIYALQQVLGHSSLDMVRRYLKYFQTDMDNLTRRTSPADNWGIR